jgi:hypothetical protein
MVLLYRVTWQRDSAVIKSPTTADYRRLSGGPVSNYTPTDHASLQHLDAATSGHTGFALTGDIPTRDSLGLDTDDSPQFAGINLGAASDTTLTREGAGDILVEGNHVYRAGGTDVAIADGGTGASTLAAAGIPTVVAALNLTVSANVAYTNILASAPVGFYRVNWAWRITTVGAAGDVVRFSTRWYNGAVVSSKVVTPQSYGDYIFGATADWNEHELSGAFGLDSCKSDVFYHSDATKHIYYYVSFTKTGSPVLDLRIRLEYLGA